MAAPFDRVRPGDLISAEQMNNILDRLKTVENKLKALEGGTPGDNPVSIARISPPGTVRVGQEIQVVGQNFGMPATSNIVSMGGLVIERFLPGSDASNLVFTVPSLPEVPSNDVLLTVRYKNSSDSIIVSVAPAVIIPGGRMIITDVTDEVGPPGLIQIGNNYTFWFKLDSQTLPGGESYELRFTYTTAVGASTTDWTTNSRLVRQSGASLVDNPIEISPGKPLRIGVNFTVPAGATSVNMTFSARSLHNDKELSTSIGPIPIAVGVVQETPDSRVRFVAQSFEDGAVGRIITEGTQKIIEVPYGDLARPGILAEIDETGDFKFTVVLEPDNGSWQLTNPSPAPTSIRHIPGGQDQLVQVNTKLNTTASPGGAHPEQRTLLVRVERQDGDKFKSWTRIPIRGYTPT